jgi:hypothetical protein
VTWVRVDDGFFEHPKTVAAGDAAAYLFLAGLGYCNRRLTDGRIPKAMVPRLTTARRWPALAARLVEVGYWEDHGDCYQSHDYLEWNDSRAEVEAKREQKATAGRAGGQASATARAQARGEAPAPTSGSESGQAKVKPSPLRSSPAPLPSVPDPPLSSLRSESAPPPLPDANGRGGATARRLPDEAALTDADEAYAKVKGFDDAGIDRMFEAFCDYHWAKGDRMRDWSAAWRTWVRRELEGRTRAAPSGGRP